VRQPLIIRMSSLQSGACLRPRFRAAITRAFVSARAMLSIGALYFARMLTPTRGSRLAKLGGALGALLAMTHAAVAQVPPKPDSTARDSLVVSVDSLAARLARAEAAIALLQQQLATEASAAVRTRSRFQLELSARVLSNSYFTSGRTNSAELPLFVRDPATPPGGSIGSAGTGALGMTLRQTLLGAAISVDSVLGATFVGDIDIDFFAGGTAYTADPFGFPEMRLRTVNAQLRWTNTTLMIGTDTPLISDLNPVSLAAVGTSGFATAGNLWNWIPQMRISRTVTRAVLRNTPVSFALHAAALAPALGVDHAAESDGIDAGERAARPALQGRMSVQWGPSDANDDARGEIGIGAHRGWARVSGDTLMSTHAIAVDAHVGLSRGVSLLGEAYTGRAISALGGGGIGQLFGAPDVGSVLGAPVRDVAGWAQLNAQLRPSVTTGAGCGLAVADARDRPRRRRNGSCEAHLIWRPTQPVLVGLEVRRLRTSYATGSYRATHVNLAVGFEW